MSDELPALEHLIDTANRIIGGLENTRKALLKTGEEANKQKAQQFVIAYEGHKKLVKAATALSSGIEGTEEAILKIVHDALGEKTRFKNTAQAADAVSKLLFIRNDELNILRNGDRAARLHYPPSPKQKAAEIAKDAKLGEEEVKEYRRSQREYEIGPDAAAEEARRAAEAKNLSAGESFIERIGKWHEEKILKGRSDTSRFMISGAESMVGIMATMTGAGMILHSALGKKRAIEEEIGPDGSIITRTTSVPMTPGERSTKFGLGAAAMALGITAMGLGMASTTVRR